MYSHLPQRLTLRLSIAFTIYLALLPIPGGSLPIPGAAQSQGENRNGKPRLGKPEGMLPDLEDAKNESQTERQPAPPIPSTIHCLNQPSTPRVSVAIVGTSMTFIKLS
jgi:hypothetical protein